ncbi:hypothetical protein CTI12_AA593850 [Artemisia annua]|uniref:Uncharacterized protein n=1 Tax=Artemisia annua TaxID=35608 RepID=A0A2U1KJZ9_ARTAN|nr:hypothetical protein CTI12_AA593850 [Artemisia annua]
MRIDDVTGLFGFDEVRRLMVDAYESLYGLWLNITNRSGVATGHEFLMNSRDFRFLKQRFLMEVSNANVWTSKRRLS